jgi:hypothetical protein
MKAAIRRIICGGAQWCKYSPLPDCSRLQRLVFARAGDWGRFKPPEQSIGVMFKSRVLLQDGGSSVRDVSRRDRSSLAGNASDGGSSKVAPSRALANGEHQ